MANAVESRFNAWAEFASGLQWNSIPAPVQERAVWLVLDTVGAIIAGLEESAAGQVRRCVPRAGASGLESALLLGVLAQAADLDETNLRAGSHIACTVVPALMAGLMESSCSGPTFLAAVVAGYELEAALGRALAPHHGARGWHPTGTLGAFGAAAAIARQLGLDPDAFGRALAIAGTQAAGTKSVFGGTAKAFNAGKAASNGLLAARLAAVGMTAGGNPLVDPRGFFAASGVGEVTMPLPATHAILENHFKFLPCCIETHAAVIAISEAMAEAGGRPPNAVTVVLAPSARVMVDRPAPAGIEEGRFSVQYAIARRLRGGPCSPVPEPFDPDALSSLCPVKIVERPINHLAAELTVHLGDHSRTTRADLGWHTPLDRERISRKFDALASPAMGERALGLREAICSMEDAANAAEVLLPVMRLAIGG